MFEKGKEKTFGGLNRTQNARNVVHHTFCLCRRHEDASRIGFTTTTSRSGSRKQKIEKLFQLYSQLRSELECIKALREEERNLIIEEQELQESLSTLKKQLEVERGKSDNAANELQRKRIQLAELQNEERIILNQITDLKGKIRVGLRIRSLLHGEEVNETLEKVKLIEGGISVGDKFVPGEFTSLWTSEVDQNSVFQDIKDFIQSVLNGYNVSILFYGESGSGKTFTMLGDREKGEGMLPRAFQFLFEAQKSLSFVGWQFSFTVSAYEVYNEKFVDLLNGKTVCMPRFLNGVLDDSCFRNIPVYTVEEGMNAIRSVSTHRTAASTGMNWSSSRSHCIFCLRITAENVVQGKTQSSVLMFVDLAGSERTKEALTKGLRFTEAKCINRSLLSLRNVIRDQLREEPVIRYRDSKLTMALSSCLGAADSKTFLFVTLNPSRESANETLRSISFASEASATNIGPACRILDDFLVSI